MRDRPELYGQTALRGVAALVVFIAHAAFFHNFPNSRTFTGFYQIFFWHNEAVDLFFVLSGFILCYVYSDRDFKWRDYFVARFARIYPVYFAALLLALALIYYDFLLGRGWGPFTPHGLVANIFLIQDWPFLPLQASYDVPTWSISTEVFLYIVLFPCLFLLNKYASLWLKIALIVLPMVVSVIVICLTWGTSSEGMDVIWPVGNPWRGVFCFTSGFFTCSVGLRNGFPNIFSRYGEVIFLLIAASCLMFQFPLDRKAAILWFPVLAYLSARPDSLLSQGLKSRFAGWLGDISYSVYVWHWPLLHVVVMTLTRLRKITGLGFWTSGYLVIAVSVALVFGVAHVSHFQFERPANKWLRRKFSRADPLPVSMR